MQRKAKIICTIGPASVEKAMLFSLIRAGMDVARLNFSHGDYEFHKKAISLLREGSRKYGKPVAILQDLQGIKIRVGSLEGGHITLKKGSDLFLMHGKDIGDSKQIFISYPNLTKDVNVGDRILLDDGLMDLKVIGKTKNSLKVKVIEGGILKEKKGVNFPGTKITMSSFTEKDKADLEFGIRMAVDYVAISFVRKAEDVRKVREWLKNKKRLSIPLIAKIEKPEALKNISEILDEADGIMVARGDLGVEVSPEDVPMLQKMLIERANRKGKLVITATQMLESMTGHTRPTRAEAADVANAVLDGTDALMLSAETSTGKYPLMALTMMDRIIRKTEGKKHIASQYIPLKSFSDAIADAASEAGEDIEAKYIVAFTQTGFTARLLSKFRPAVPIMAFTPFEAVRRRMSLYWGVIPKTMMPVKSTDAVFRGVETELLKDGMVRHGDTIVITASSPVIGVGKTNLLKVQQIGGM